MQSKHDEKVVLCYSGGYDSVALLEFLLDSGFEEENVHLMFFDMGQKNLRQEDKMLGMTKRRYPKLTVKVVDIDTCHMKKNGDNVYYPMRNLVFLSTSLSYAELIGAEHIAMGFVGLGEYPDTTVEFATLFNSLAVMQAGIGLLRPFHGLTKIEVAENVLYPIGGEDLVLRVLEESFSCNVPSKFPVRPCGVCPDCIERREILEKFSSTPIAELAKTDV